MQDYQRRPSRRWLVTFVVLLGAAVLAAIAIGMEFASGRGDTQISNEELAGLPPIVLVWAERQRAKSTASGDLYMARPEGNRARLVKAWLGLGDAGEGGTYGVSDAGWSPDRTWIALNLSVWTSDPDGQVAIIRPTGGALRRLGVPSWTAGHATWSPNGRQLAYTVLGGVWVYSPATDRLARIWRARGHGTVAGIAWSPNGRRLAVAEEDEGIVTMSVGGAAMMRLTHGDDRAPRWSPDGRRIVFSRYGTGPDPYLWTVDVDGGRPRRLTSGQSPEPSPDGRSLLLTRTREKTDEWTGYVSDLPDVYVADADGRNVRRLTSDGLSAPLGWSPDGSKILFARETHDDDPDKPWSELWIMDADGGRQTRLPFNRARWSVLSADWGG